MTTRPIGFRPSRSEFLQIRNTRCHMRRWGDPTAPLLFLFHGYLDLSISWQFVVDHLARDWNIVAPDRRGTGASQWGGDCYTWLDQLADFDAVLDHYSPAAPARVVAHSQGAAHVHVLAALRPKRIAGIVSLEGVGPPPVRDEQTVKRLERYLDDMRAGPRLRTYADHAAMAASLHRSNPRLTPERAAFLAEHFAHRLPDGRLTFAVEPWLNVAVPVPYGKSLLRDTWPKITAPLLMVLGEDSAIVRLFRELGEFDDRMAHLKTARQVWLPDAGHNLHQEHPERVAALIEEFFASVPPMP